jgi:hypothetical protein
MRFIATGGHHAHDCPYWLVVMEQGEVVVLEVA